MKNDSTQHTDDHSKYIILFCKLNEYFFEQKKLTKWTNWIATTVLVFLDINDTLRPDFVVISLKWLKMANDRKWLHLCITWEISRWQNVFDKVKQWNVVVIASHSSEFLCILPNSSTKCFKQERIETRASKNERPMIKIKIV